MCLTIKPKKSDGLMFYISVSSFFIVGINTNWQKEFKADLSSKLYGECVCIPMKERLCMHILSGSNYLNWYNILPTECLHKPLIINFSHISMDVSTTLKGASLINHR
jgi:hypothetical protein